MCYKIEKQKRNDEKLKKKLDEAGIPTYMRNFFLIKIESKAGAINYLGVIKNLLHYFMEQKIINRNSISDIKSEDFSEIMAEDISAYLKMKEENGMSPTTLETRKNIIRSFWNYMSRVKGSGIPKDFFEDVSYKGISSSDNLVRKLPSDKQMETIEEKIVNKNNIFLRSRNLAVFKTLKGTGLRESELVGLDLDDLYLDEDEPYIMILGKGVYRERQSRQVKITKSAVESLQEWLDERNKMNTNKDLDAVFITQKGKRMTESDVRRLFEHASSKQVSPHMIRHWYATTMTPIFGIVFVRQQLGHTSENTTINNYANGSYGTKELLASM